MVIPHCTVGIHHRWSVLRGVDYGRHVINESPGLICIEKQIPDLAYAVVSPDSQEAVIPQAVLFERISTRVPTVVHVVGPG